MVSAWVESKSSEIWIPNGWPAALRPGSGPSTSSQVFGVRPDDAHRSVRHCVSCGNQKSATPPYRPVLGLRTLRSTCGSIAPAFRPMSATTSAWSTASSTNRAAGTMKANRSCPR